MKKSQFKTLIKAIIKESFSNEQPIYKDCQKCKGQGRYTTKLKDLGGKGRVGVDDTHIIPCDAPGCKNGKANPQAYYDSMGVKESDGNIQNSSKQTQTDIYSKLGKLGFHENGNEPRIYMEYYRYNFATIQCSVNVFEKNVRLETYYDSERINDEKAKVYTFPVPETYSQDFADKVVLACSRLKKSIDGDEPVFGDIDDINENDGVAGQHLINGQSNKVAAGRVNKILGELSKGMFSDNSWEAIHKIFNKLQEVGLDVTITDAKYGGHADSKHGMPTFKEWKISIPFTNKNGKQVALIGQITAHGAGSIEQPLDRYDITAMVTPIMVKN